MVVCPAKFRHISEGAVGSCGVTCCYKTEKFDAMVGTIVAFSGREINVNLVKALECASKGVIMGEHNG